MRGILTTGLRARQTGALAVGIVRSGLGTDTLMFAVSLQTGELSLTQRAFERGTEPVAFSETGRFVIVTRAQTNGTTLVSTHRVAPALGAWDQTPSGQIVMTASPNASLDSFDRVPTDVNSELQTQYRKVVVDDLDGALTITPPILLFGSMYQNVFDLPRGVSWRTRGTFLGKAEASTYVLNRSAGSAGTAVRLSANVVPAGFTFLFLDPARRFLFSGSNYTSCTRSSCFGDKDEFFVAAIDPRTGELSAPGKSAIGGHGLISAALYTN